MMKKSMRTLNESTKTLKVVGQGCLDDCWVPYTVFVPQYRFGRIIGVMPIVQFKRTAFISTRL